MASAAMPIMAGLTMTGSYMKGREEQGQAESTADILEYNKAVEQENAKAVQYPSVAEQAKLERQKRLMIGKQAVGYGKSGFTQAGTPLSIMADTVSQYELDKATTQWNANIQAGKYESQANIYGASAEAQRQKAKTALPRALLTGAMSAGNIYAASKINPLARYYTGMYNW